MTPIWKRNRDRRRARAAARLMQHAEGQWRAEIELLKAKRMLNDIVFTDTLSKVYVYAEALTLIAEDDEDYRGRVYEYRAIAQSALERG